MNTVGLCMFLNGDVASVHLGNTVLQEDIYHWGQLTILILLWLQNMSCQPLFLCPCLPLTAIVTPPPQTLLEP